MKSIELCIKKLPPSIKIEEFYDGGIFQEMKDDLFLQSLCTYFREIHLKRRDQR